MGKMLKLEFRKLFKGKALYFCTLAVILPAVLMNVIAFSVDSVLKIDSSSTGTELVMFAVFSSVLVMVLGIFTSIFVCSDYSDGALKTVFSRGNTRTNVFFAKFIVLSVAALIMFTGLLVVNYVLGTILWEPGPFITGKQILALLSQFVLIEAYLSIYMLFSYVFTKLGAAIPVNLFALDVAYLIFQLLDLIIRSKSELFVKIHPDYWMTLVSSDYVVMRDVSYALIFGAAFIMIFGFLAWLVSSKKEV